MSYIGKKNGNPNTDFLEAGGELENHDLVNVDSSGNVLVGKTSSGNTIGGATISPDGMLQSTIKTSGGASQNIFVNRQDTDGNFIVFRKANADVGSISTEGNDLAIGNADAGLQFINGTQSVRPFNMTTNARLDAQIDLGMSTTRFQDLYLSGGVYVGGTGSANYLDDYEEGTWTGSVITNGFTQSISSIDGTYTKVGRLVVIHYIITLSSSGYASSYSYLSGLPFASGSVSQVGGYYANGQISANGIGSTNFLNSLSSTVYLFKSSTISSTHWIGSFHYYTA
jgi:hypothetical protein